MNKFTAFLYVSLIILMLAACSTKPTAVPVLETLEPTPELIEPAPTLTIETNEAEPEDAVYKAEVTTTYRFWWLDLWTH